MELAAISPLNCLDITKQFKYHLIETYWLVKYKVYRKFYEELSKEKDRFLILDNSEGIGHYMETDAVLEFADKLNVQEVVMPDVSPVKSNDPEGAYKTFDLCVDFMDEIGDAKFNLMGVVHGKTIEEASMLLELFEDITVGFPNKAIIPREFLMRYCNIPVERRHMLGASSVRELVNCKDLARSVDTNLPFRAANSKSHIYTYRDQDVKEPFHPEMKMLSTDRADAYAGYVVRVIK